MRPGGHSIQPCFSRCFYHDLCHQKLSKCTSGTLALMHGVGVGSKVFYFEEKP